MAYTKTAWVDNSAPAINASNLNKIEQGVFDAHSSLASMSFSVKDYGALGDNTTDDTTAIEEAITAAGVGGVVAFPRGVYKVSRTLWPMDAQVWTGVHSPHYAITDDPYSTCKIIPAASFTGRAVIERGEAVHAVTIERLCLHGRGDTDPVEIHGIHFGDMSGERSWMLNQVTVHGFSGCGITGRMHVVDLRDCHSARNGYGLRVVGNNAMNDCRIYGSQFYYNLYGGVCLDSTTRRSGAVTFHGCRIERSGSTPNVPETNRNFDSPGIRLGNAQNIDIVQCSTDANSGAGLHIEPTLGNYVYAVSVTGCQFMRDGGADQSPGVQGAGVKIKNATHIYFVGNQVTWGAANDDGGSGLISPYYSVWIEDSFSCKITDSWITAPDPDNSVHLVGDNYASQVEAMDLGLASSPPHDDSSRATSGLIEGSWYWSRSTQRPLWWDGSEWRDAMGEPEAGSTVPTNLLDIYGTVAQDKVIRYSSGGVEKWVVGVNPDASGAAYSIRRMIGTGVYLDDPVNINATTGQVSLAQTYVSSKSDTATALEVRTFDTTPAASFFVCALSDGTKKFEVRYDGRLRSNWGSGDYAMTQIGCTQIVRQGASGSQTMLGVYTSTANADTDSSVFEVYADGRAKIGAAVNGSDAVRKDQIKAIAAASTDFADFKSRIAAW